MAKSICNIPEDLLVSQVIIECIPDIVLLSMLTGITTLVILYWHNWRKSTKWNEMCKMYVVAGLFVIFCPLWYAASGLMVNVLTDAANPEYAAIVKFNNTCGTAR